MPTHPEAKMRIRPRRAITILLLASLVLPVLVKQVLPDERRSYTGVSLDELEFEEITFQNEKQNLQLAGLLFSPEGDGPFPAVVIIHGSGTSQRNNGWYLTLVDHLQRNGIMVLLPDKRGSVESEGDWRTSSYEDLATDTIAGAEYLRDSYGDRVSGIGVVGMSEGGRIAPIVASHSIDLAFVVNMVGGAVPAHDALLFEEVHNIRQVGVLPGFAHLFAYVGRWSLISFRMREFWDAVGDFDPLPYWREVSTPALVLYGAEDTNVPSHASAERLEGIRNPNIEVAIFEGSGHALESPEGQGTSIIRPEVLERISSLASSTASYINAEGSP